MRGNYVTETLKTFKSCNKQRNGCFVISDQNKI